MRRVRGALPAAGVMLAIAIAQHAWGQESSDNSRRTIGNLRPDSYQRRTIGNIRPNASPGVQATQGSSRRQPGVYRRRGYYGRPYPRYYYGYQPYYRYGGYGYQSYYGFPYRRYYRPYGYIPPVYMPAGAFFGPGAVMQFFFGIR